MSPGELVVVRSCIRVVVVGSHQLFSDALAWRLQQEPDVVVVGTADSTPGTPTLVAGGRPDVVVAELRGDGDLEFLHGLSSLSPAVRTCVVTALDDGPMLARAFAAGAFAALARTTSTEQLVAAVRHVADGQCFVTPQLVPRLLTALRERGEGAPRYPGAPQPDERLARLTPRELDVLELLVSGMDRTAIAEHMVLSVHTIGTHIKHLLAKLGVHSTLEAVSVGLQAGLRPLPSDNLHYVK